MLRSLKEVQADDSVVGFYQATTLGAFFNQTLVDTQAIHREKLRHGGAVIVHGWPNFPFDGCYVSLIPWKISRRLRGGMHLSALFG
jgi:hypothetical protein